jgi:hypothetical protein
MPGGRTQAGREDIQNCVGSAQDAAIRLDFHRRQCNQCGSGKIAGVEGHSVSRRRPAQEGPCYFGYFNHATGEVPIKCGIGCNAARHETRIPVQARHCEKSCTRIFLIIICSSCCGIKGCKHHQTRNRLQVQNRLGKINNLITPDFIAIAR